jgi:hypothetical protein
MAFEVTLYEFQKRHNSTRRPSGGSVPFNGTLREGSSLITPTIGFEFASNASPMSNSWDLHFNYAYVAKFARYYWITDWTYDGGLWHAAMKVDVLATYRPQILAASAFVAYDESTNTDLIDSRQSMLMAKVIVSKTAMFSKLGQNYGDDGGAVAVLCTGKNSTAAFVMTPADISHLMDNIVTWASATFTDPATQYPGSPTDSFGEAMWQALLGACSYLKRIVVNLSSNGDAAQNLRAAVQLPVAISDVPGTTQQIVLGQYETNVYAKKISSRLLYDNCQVQIPWRFTDWRCNEPYTEIFLYIPYVGNIKMPNASLIGETHLKVYAVVDLMSGDAVFRVFAEPSDKLIGSYSSNVGASYPIGVSNISPAQTVTGIAGAVGAIAAGAAKGGGAGAAIGALGAVTGIMAANTPQSSSIGGGGGGASQGLPGSCIVTVITHDIDQSPVDAPVVAIMGSPTMKVKSLANVTGYLETRGAAVAGNMTATEHAELNAMLDSGIYVELGG